MTSDRVSGGTALSAVIGWLSSLPAPGLMGASVAGDITFGFVYGIGLIIMTWAITLLYLRKSDREWGPLERRAIERAPGPGDGRARHEEAVR